LEHSYEPDEDEDYDEDVYESADSGLQQRVGDWMQMAGLDMKIPGISGEQRAKFAQELIRELGVSDEEQFEQYEDNEQPYLMAIFNSIDSTMEGTEESRLNETRSNQARAIDAINNSFPEANAVPSEEFDSSSRGGIWFRQEGGSAPDGQPLYDEYVHQDTFGTHPDLEALLGKLGYFSEPYDAGTLMAYEA